MKLLVALVLLPGLLLAQAAEKNTEPGPEKRKTAGEIEIPDPGIPVEDPNVARAELARFQQAFRKAKNDPGARVELLGKIGGFDHRSIYREVSKHVKSKEYQVAVAAAVAVARQSTSRDKAAKLLFKVAGKDKRTNVVCAALVGMGKLEFLDKSSYKLAENLFKMDRRERRKAATRYLGYVRAKQAFKLIAEQLDEPAPKDPDDPLNPPAAWWKERWEEWQSNLPYYQWALSRIVPGETFETMREAKEWAESEGKQHGIKW